MLVETKAVSAIYTVFHIPFSYQLCMGWFIRYPSAQLVMRSASQFHVQGISKCVWE
jgi:hypothetical protein